MGNVISKYQICFLLLLTSICTAAQASQQAYRILVIDSYPSSMSWSHNYVDQLRSSLSDRDVWVRYFPYERMDNAESRLSVTQTDLLKETLFYYQFDLIVTVGAEALHSITRIKNQSNLNTPVVATGANLTSFLGMGSNDFAGLSESVSLAPLLATIQELHPDLRKLHLVINDSRQLKNITAQFLDVSSSLNIEPQIFKDDTDTSLLQWMSTLHEDDVILLAADNLSSRLHNIEQKQNYQFWELQLDSPIYSLWEYPLGKGALAGYRQPPGSFALETGKLIRRFIDGESLGQLGVKNSRTLQLVFDSQQLDRFELSKSQLPHDSYLLGDKPQLSVPVSIQLAIVLLTIIVGTWLLFKVIPNQIKRRSRNSDSPRIKFDSHNLKTQRIVVDDALQIQSLAATSGSGLPLLAGLTIGDKLGFSGHNTEQCLKLLEQSLEHCQPNLEQQLILVFNSKSKSDQHSVLVTVSSLEGTSKAYLIESISVTRLSQEYQDIKRSELRYRSLFDSSPRPLLVINALGVVRNSNLVAANLFGYDDTEQLNLSQLSGFYETADERIELKRILQKQHSTLAPVTRELSYRIGEQRYLVRESISYIENQNLFFVVIEDITQSRALQSEIEFYANFDELTLLHNRGYFERYFKSLDTNFPKSTDFSLILVDLDQFRTINDSFGHHAGNRVLTQVARLLHNLTPKQCELARIASDEFAILWPDSSEQQLLVFVEQIIQAISHEQVLFDANIVEISCSIGISKCLKELGSFQIALAQAQSASDLAKTQGGRRFQFFEQSNQSFLKQQGQSQWVARIQAALRENRFVLYAQQIVPLDPNRKHALHYEVLVRLIDEQGQVIAPGAFIEAAENYRLMESLDRMIVQKTLAWLEENPAHLARLSNCSINLSGQSLSNPEFVDWLLDLLESSSIALDKLCFETTETVAISNLDLATELFDRVRNLGCKVALDDFGSGLSSFGYFKKLPIDYLKIDGIFIRDIAHDQQDEAIVRSINQLAQVLGKETVAEFVENQDIADKLSEIGVTFAQGYHFSKPAPIDMLVIQ